jgi:DNA-binding Xre family transcriptional regulator
MTSLSKLAYHNNFNKITESLINFFNQELNCDNWDLIKIPDKKKKKYYPTFTHFRNLVLPANNKIWLSTNTVSILTKNKNIRFEKITTLKNMSLYEELILNNFSHRLIIPILNEEDFIVGIISLYFG